MSISRTKWDRWAPAAYLFIIGLALGFAVGFALGLTGCSAPNAVYLAIVPVAVILGAFVVLVLIARKVENGPGK
jgi:hypothetical protein